jgi:anti-anti-sigma factor
MSVIDVRSGVDETPLIKTFSVSQCFREGCRVLVLGGDLDMAEVAMLEAEIDACTDGIPIVVDMTSLTFIDSTAIHALLRKRKAGRPAAIVRAPASIVARVLDIVGATQTISVYDELTKAVEHIGAHTES